MITLALQKFKLPEVQRKKTLPQAVKIRLMSPCYVHVQHTIYVSIQFLEEIEKGTEGRERKSEITASKLIYVL